MDSGPIKIPASTERVSRPVEEAHTAAHTESELPKYISPEEMDEKLPTYAEVRSSGSDSSPAYKLEDSSSVSTVENLGEDDNAIVDGPENSIRG